MAMLREFRTNIILFAILFVMTGLGYPMLTLFLGQKLLPAQANGSLITVDGKIIGSSLIGQNFASDIYFHGRPSAECDNGYDATNSSGSNLATTSPDLLKAVTQRVTDLKSTGNARIPVDLVTASASGLDPDISPDAAHFQATRVAAARHLTVMQVNDLINSMITHRSLGILGDNRVNVLNLNQALDHLQSSP